MKLSANGNGSVLAVFVLSSALKKYVFKFLKNNIVEYVMLSLAGCELVINTPKVTKLPTHSPDCPPLAGRHPTPIPHQKFTHQASRPDKLAFNCLRVIYSGILQVVPSVKPIWGIERGLSGG